MLVEFYEFVRIYYSFQPIANLLMETKFHCFPYLMVRDALTNSHVQVHIIEITLTGKHAVCGVNFFRLEMSCVCLATLNFSK